MTAVLGRLRRVVTSPVLVAVAGGLVIGGILLRGAGVDPFAAYGALLEGATTGRGPSAVLQRVVPLGGAALAFGIALRGGAFNLGGEGQVALGGLAAVVVARSEVVPDPLLLPAVLLAAAAGGALWALGPAVLQVRTGVPLLITTLLLGFIGRSVVSWATAFPLKAAGAQTAQTAELPAAARLADLTPTISSGLLLVLALLVVLVVVDRRTSLGYQVRMMGLNPRFAAYGGVPTDRLLLQVMTASGATYGVVGGLLVTSFPYRLSEPLLIAPLYVWNGLLAALLGMAVPLGVAAAALAFAALQIGSEAMERTTGIPRELANVLQATIIVMLASRGLSTALGRLRPRRRPDDGRPDDVRPDAQAEVS